MKLNAIETNNFMIFSKENTPYTKHIFKYRIIGCEGSGIYYLKGVKFRGHHSSAYNFPLNFDVFNCSGTIEKLVITKVNTR